MWVRLNKLLLALGILIAALPAHAQLSEQNIGTVIVDHTSVVLFEQIPAEYKQRAQNIRMLFVDRSVGSNLNDGLNCLAQDEAAAQNSCKSWEPNSPPEHWSGTWPRDNWTFGGWPVQDPLPNKIACSGWNGVWTGYQPCFFNYVQSRLDQWDVLSFWFDYNAAIWTGTPLAAYFTNRTGTDDAFDYAAMEGQIAPKRLVYWTTSLPRSDNGSGQIARLAAFNDAARAFVGIASNRILFDAADILSHDPAGNTCRNADGLPVICSPQYTTEATGGHLGSYSNGKIRLAKAFHVLMAKLSGWDPDGDPDPPPPPDTQDPTLLISCAPTGVPNQTRCDATFDDNVGVVHIDWHVAATVRDAAGNTATDEVTYGHDIP